MGKGDPKKPRGKMSSYAFFVQTCWEEHKKKHPDASVNFSEFSKKCSERWKTMSAKEKGKFKDMAKVNKARYEREMKTYIPPKGETKKKFKDPNAPKRPPSAFFLFCSEYRPKIKGEHPGLSIGDVAKKLGEMWNNTAADANRARDVMAPCVVAAAAQGAGPWRGAGGGSGVVVTPFAPTARSPGAETGRSLCCCVALTSSSPPCSLAPLFPFLRPPLTRRSMEVMEGPLNLAHLSLELQRDSHMKQFLLIQERWKRAKREERWKAQQSMDRDAAAHVQTSHKPPAEDAEGHSPLLAQKYS
ncbi:High mobility group protein B1 [Tupaia chinensis]|uniref:High mobility group protein B1 n=1 Tax=Tupaia chinensis TaxID=246437 RepID=L9KGT7_TUPCH|nr:High mobility group protein B1 [Tupaia chinensis]